MKGRENSAGRTIAADERKLVFIGGLHRSGTTLLAKCLAEHPGVSTFQSTGYPRDEGQFLQTVYPIARLLGGPGRFAFHPESHLTEESPLSVLGNADRLWGEWAPYWDLGRPVLLEKSPPNLLRYRFLQTLFPGSLFITIVRHPIAVSLSTHKWRKTQLADLIEHWLVCHELWSADRQHLVWELAFKYEEFVRSPQVYLEQVFQALKLDSVPMRRQVKRDANQKYFQAWMTRRDHLFRGRQWRSIVDRFEGRVSAFGYSLTDCRFLGKLPDKMVGLHP